MKKLVPTISIVLVIAAFAPANPIPWPPPASMPLEDMHVQIEPAADGLCAAFTGDFTFTHIPKDVHSMLFPVPPDARNICVRQDGVQLPWTWSAELYPTVLPELPTIPMIEWQGPFPEHGAVFTVSYGHDLIKREREFIFFYAVGTGKYFPTYEKTTTANFDILVPEGFTVGGVWLDNTPHEYEFIEPHLTLTVQSHFGPIKNDLIVSLQPSYGFTDCGILVQGVECILFQADSGGLYILENRGTFHIGDRVRVTGDLDPFCYSFCMQGDGCIINNTISQCSDPAWWPPSNVQIVPQDPTSSDVIEVTLSGEWPHSCIPTDSDVLVSGNDIYFDVVSYSGMLRPCALVVTPWHQTQSVGPLSPGTYRLYARHVYYPLWRVPYPDPVPEPDKYTLLTQFDVISSTFHVDAADGSDDNDGLTPETAFATIQKGIDMAQDGDTVIVHPGIYLDPDPRSNDNINFLGKNITLTSTDPTNPDIVNSTVIRGRMTIPSVQFHGTEGPDCVLTGFKIDGAIFGLDYSIDPTGDNHTHATISHCIIQGNHVACGMAISDCDGTINNCLIADNITNGSCLFASISGCHGLIINCTIAGNEAGLFVRAGGTTTLQNCIIYDNDEYFFGQIAVFSGATLDISYCDLQGGLDGISAYGTVNWGPGNIAADPCFARLGYRDFDDPWEIFEGDYHLQSAAGRWDPNRGAWVVDANTSLCIDAGNPGCPLGDEPNDPGNTRINMGAYGGTVQASKTPSQWSLLADLTNDRVVDSNDLAVFANLWLGTDLHIPCDLNRNQAVDFLDYAILAQSWLNCASSQGGEDDIAKPALSKYYLPYDNPIKPNAPGYTLPLDLETVTNYSAMDVWFGLDSSKTSLEQKGFTVIEYDFQMPDDDGDDIVTPYEYLYQMNVPLFITADTMLHLYHIQFDETLKDIEQREFYGDIHDLTSALLGEALSLYQEHTGDLKEAAKRNVAYLGVAQQLIEPAADVPELVADLVEGELAKIAAHTGFSPSDIFIYKEDYSQYVPRGHYTRSEELKRYFKTLMWYGRMAFLLKGSENWGQTGDALISTHDAIIQTTQAVLLAKSIEQVQLGQRSGRQIWDRIYAVTSFYVGLADDLTPHEYLGAVNKIFGGSFVPTDLENADNFFSLKVELALLRSPQIYGGTGNVILTPPITPEALDELLDKTKGMRFMGQRFIPDSYMFQHLVFPEVLDYMGHADPLPFTCGFTGGRLARCYPRGLDVMALLGSARAEAILAAEGDTDYVDYALRFSELKAEFNAFDIRDWNRNLYWGWLYSLAALIDEFGEGYPSFMRTDAWQKKELNAALASWTELRHDTILYAKQSYTPGETSVPPPPTGYVEPVPEFYGRLLALTRMTREGLSDLDALSAEAAQRLISLENILSRLLEIANKELMNQALSEDDCYYLEAFAKALEGAITGVEEQGIKTTLVADVHTHTVEAMVLEEGVGYVDLIIVACPTPDGLIFLAAGPVLSYYEFKHAMSDRLTDEAWRELLGSPQRPDRPMWYQPFVH